VEPHIWTIEPDEATREAASDACFVQDAVNGRAVLASLVRHLDAMPDLDGDRKNQHPVTIAYLDKMLSLARAQGHCDERTNAAHVACEKLRKGEPVEWLIYPI